jgi:hypothetical protein
VLAFEFPLVNWNEKRQFHEYFPRIATFGQYQLEYRVIRRPNPPPVVGRAKPDGVDTWGNINEN